MSRQQTIAVVGAGLLGLVLSIVFYAPVQIFDAPRLGAAGQSFYLFGLAPAPAMLPEHGHLVMGPLVTVGGWLGHPLLLVQLHAIAIPCVLAGVLSQRAPVGGLLAAASFVFAPAVTMVHWVNAPELVGLLWVLVTWWALTRAESSPHRGWLLLCFVAAMLACLADLSGIVAVGMLGLTCAWRVGSKPGVAWLLPSALAVAVLLGLSAAFPGNYAAFFHTFDARFYDGYDHLRYVGFSIWTLQIPLGLVVLLGWLARGLWRHLLFGLPPAAARIVLPLLIAQLVSWLVIRVPTWPSTSIYLAGAIAILLGTLGAQISEALLRNASLIWRLLGALLVALLLLGGLPANLALVSASRAERLEMRAGWRVWSFEHRTAFVVAEGLRGDGPVYFGEGLVCSESCMSMGRPRRFVPANRMADLAVDETGVLVIRASAAASSAVLDARTVLILDRSIAFVRLGNAAPAAPKQAQQPMTISKRLMRLGAYPAQTVLTIGEPDGKVKK